jgi:hypothetical protein
VHDSHDWPAEGHYLPRIAEEPIGPELPREQEPEENCQHRKR